MKTWAKYGLRLWVIYLIVVILSGINYFLTRPGTHGTIGEWIIILSAFPLSIIIPPVGFLLVLSGFLFSPVYFLIGAIIGWIVGKVKSRKQKI